MAAAILSHAAMQSDLDTACIRNTIPLERKLCFPEIGSSADAQH